MINKNGNIQISEINESDAMRMNSNMTAVYSPTKDAQNSCMNVCDIKGFEEGKKYYLEMDIIWSGFKDNSASNFGSWAQGATWNGSSWDWNVGNPLAGLVNSLAGSNGKITSLLLSETSGSKHIKGFFTANSRTGYALGCRTDYSNGVGAIKFANVRVVPAEYAIDNSTSYGKIASDKIIIKEIIEY